MLCLVALCLAEVISLYNIRKGLSQVEKDNVSEFQALSLAYRKLEAVSEIRVAESKTWIM